MPSPSDSSRSTMQEEAFRSSPPAVPNNLSVPQINFNSDPVDLSEVGQTRRQVTRASSIDSARPDSAQRGQADETETLDTTEDLESEEESDPADGIPDFNWNDLHERYHAAINKCHADEELLMLEWETLMQFFKVWATSGHGQETDRTYSRFRTRMAYVQNSEQNLEKTRAHYINVVNAFENALKLLRNQGFPG